MTTHRETLDHLLDRKALTEAQASELLVALTDPTMDAAMAGAFLAALRAKGVTADEVRGLPQSPCKAYVGTEVKVEYLDGSIDTCPAIADICDFIMASVHRFPDSNGNAIAFADIVPTEAIDLEYQLTWEVLANPQVDILGHVFGMSYRRYGVVPSPKRIKELIARAAEFDVAVEINSHYHPNPHEMIKWASEIGALVTFGSNAHSLDKVGHIMARLCGENRE